MTSGGTAAPTVGLISRARRTRKGGLGCAVDRWGLSQAATYHFADSAEASSFAMRESKAAADKICVNCQPPPSDPIPMFFWDDEKLN